jgi:hypothetical protein
MVDKRSPEQLAEDSRVRTMVMRKQGFTPFRAGSPLPDEAEEGVDVTGRRLGLLDVGAHDCRWINGDPLADHTFCGKPVKEGTSWCPEHHARVYINRGQ